MPLLRGKQNVGKNIATEMAAGKPRKQAIAIALSVTRRGSSKSPNGQGSGFRRGTKRKNSRSGADTLPLRKRH